MNTNIDAIDKLTKHSYLTKCQAQYLNDKKQSLHSEQVLVLGDFTEIDQFLIQEEIQSFIGVRSTVSYIQLLFILKIIQAVFGTSPSVLYRMTTPIIHFLSMRFKRQWSITFTNYYHKSKSCFNSDFNKL